MTSCRSIETAISCERDLTEDLILHAGSCSDCQTQLAIHRRLVALWPAAGHQLPDPPQVIPLERARPLGRTGRFVIGAWSLATILVGLFAVDHAKQSVSFDGATAVGLLFAAVVAAALLTLSPMRILIRKLVLPFWRPD